MTDGERAELFDPGAPWDEQGDHGVSRAEVEGFTAYPMFWLSESYAGYHLQVIFANDYTPSVGVAAHEAMDSMMLIYGDCAITTASTDCAPPIHLSMGPI